MPLATERATVRDIAWMAGLFEGEGHANIEKSCTRVSLGQIDTWILRRLQAFVGGQIKRHTRQYGQPFYNWTINGMLARAFLMTIYAFLSPRKKAQAKRALGR